MTRNSLILTAVAFAMTAAPAFANGDHSTASQLDQIAAVAKQTQSEAREAATLLRAKNPDYERVNGMMETLRGHSAEVNRLIAEFEGANHSMTSSQRAEFDRLKELAQLLDIFVTNKSNMLTASKRDRNLLRAKADGIAKRAEMVHQSALKIRS